MSTRWLSCIRTTTNLITGPRRSLREGDGSSGATLSGRRRGANPLCACAQQSANPADKTYANQLKGAAILEPIALRQPLHPGVAHYLIHLYDYPAIAFKGIEAARRYAKIAPDAPHALHMPSHIFTRVGYWNDSIASNVASAQSAKNSSDFSDELHAMDYLVYAYLQLGQDDKAKAVVDEMKTVTGFSETFIPGPYAEAASPARYALERGDWKAAEALTVRPTPLANVQAITYFARALGAARAGDPEAAKPDIAKLGELRDKLREAKDGYWSEQVDIQSQVASAWLLYAEGKKDDALKAMSDAADAEDRTEKHPVTPGGPKPARELYGEMLLDSGHAKEALTAFEATTEQGAEPAGRPRRRGQRRSATGRHRQGPGLFWQGRGASRQRG